MEMKTSGIKNPLAQMLVAITLLTPATAVLADEIEDAIESIDTQTRSFVVGGKALYVDDKTDYDDDYKRFEDLKVGDKVEVDYRNDNGRFLATEIERDD
jgi:hypothetical protein